MMTKFGIATLALTLMAGSAFAAGPRRHEKDHRGNGDHRHVVRRQNVHVGYGRTPHVYYGRLGGNFDYGNVAVRRGHGVTIVPQGYSHSVGRTPNHDGKGHRHNHGH